MPTVIPGACQVTTVGTVLGNAWANVFTVGKLSSAVLTEAEAQDIANAIVAAYSGPLNDVLSNDWNIATTRVLDLETSTSPSYTFGTSVAGVLTSENAPPDQSLVVTWVTGFRGPRYRGRTFLPGWTEANNEDNGRPGSGTVTAVNNWAQAMQDNLVAEGRVLGVGHPDLNTYTAVEGYITRTVWRRQRRRTFNS